MVIIFLESGYVKKFYTEVSETKMETCIGNVINTAHVLKPYQKITRGLRSSMDLR